ncbi:hypothetical protein SRHO_G00214320 [Serrasalmus rhombeus]
MRRRGGAQVAGPSTHTPSTRGQVHDTDRVKVPLYREALQAPQLVFLNMELFEAVDCCGRDLGHSPFSPPACGSSGDPRPPAAPLREYVMTTVPGSFTPPRTSVQFLSQHRRPCSSCTSTALQKRSDA